MTKGLDGIRTEAEIVTLKLQSLASTTRPRELVCHYSEKPPHIFTYRIIFLYLGF